MTPTAITPASKMRVVTNASEKPSCCRLRTENSATAVPMQARATTISRKPPNRMGVVAPALMMKSGSVFTWLYRASDGIETKVIR